MSDLYFPSIVFSLVFQLWFHVFRFNFVSLASLWCALILSVNVIVRTPGTPSTNNRADQVRWCEECGFMTAIEDYCICCGGEWSYYRP